MLTAFTTAPGKMTINSPSIGSNPIQDSPEMIIELLAERPEIGNFFSPNRTPAQLVGYYNPVLDRVELYIVNSNGNQFLNIGS